MRTCRWARDSRHCTAWPPRTAATVYSLKTSLSSSLSLTVTVHWLSFWLLTPSQGLESAADALHETAFDTEIQVGNTWKHVETGPNRLQDCTESLKSRPSGPPNPLVSCCSLPAETSRWASRVAQGPQKITSCIGASPVKRQAIREAPGRRLRGISGMDLAKQAKSIQI